eukprot:m.17835 g.17835  ORF g.17835 m.17835 type:complete len:363 (-) comp3539_c0_seq1:61-1149(-)
MDSDGRTTTKEDPHDEHTKDAVDPVTPTDAASAPCSNNATETLGGSFYSRFPVSQDGACPYCRSWDVQYLVVSTDAPTDTTSGSTAVPEQSYRAAAPPPADVLQRLLDAKRAARVWPTESCPEPSSFRCVTCGYGFNIDETTTSIETIFYWYLNAPPEPSTDAGTGCVASACTLESSTAVSVSAAVAMAGDGEPSLPTDPAYWQSDINQFRLQQASWSRPIAAIQIDARAAALEMVLDKIGGGAKASGSTDTVTDNGSAPSVSTAGNPSWVTDYKDYSVTGNFTEMSGRFTAQSHEDYWEKKRLPKQRELRMIGRYMDPSQLVEDADTAEERSKHKRKLTKKEVKQFKERKKAKKLKAQLAM